MQIAWQTYGKSLTEDRAYNLLVSLFGVEDIVRQYSDERYPFACDFYVKSRDMFIELNAFWSHGGHWYNPNNPLDVDKANIWLDKKRAIYLTCYNVWTNNDVIKRKKAKNSCLNYLVFWKNDLSDVICWIENGCPNGVDYDIEYSWKFLI